MENRYILNKIKKNIGIIGVVIAAILLRLLPHPPNFAPIGALALFSGANLSKKQAILIAFSAMIISDLFLGFHGTMPFVYGSFLATIFIGSLLKKRQKASYLFSASLASSVLFFIITNFGVWLVGDMYPKTMSGLVNAYALAVPFFRNTILGDLVYTFSFFYGYKYVQSVINQYFFAKINKNKH